MVRISLLFVLLTAASAVAAAPREYKIGAVTITEPWSRATPGPTAVIYAKFVNGAAVSDRVLEAHTEVADRCEFHVHELDNGVMRMKAIADLPLPPGTTVSLAPGGLHLMLFGLHAPLRAGERFPLVLTFEHAGTATVEVSVGTAGAEVPQD
jgi:periplasmic copper chaperone A